MYDDAYLMGKVTAARQAEFQAISARRQALAGETPVRLSGIRVLAERLSSWSGNRLPSGSNRRPVVGGA